MLSEVLDHFGFARDFYGAGYHETPYHRQVLQNLRGAIHAGRLIAFTGLVGSGKTLLLRQLRDILGDGKDSRQILHTGTQGSRATWTS